MRWRPWLLLAILVAGCARQPEVVLLCAGIPYAPYAHEHEPWAHELFDEQARVAEADDVEIGKVARPMNGRWTHVGVDGRRTWTPPNPTREVWVLGGSVAFGIGQRDEHTIQSEMAKAAHAEGVSVRVRNFGFPGYVRWQEVALLRRLLATRKAPDLVVLYDGINDLSLLCRQLADGDPYDPEGLMPPGNIPDDPVAECKDRPTTYGRQLARGLQEVTGATDALVVWQAQFTTKKLAPADAPLVERLQAEGQTAGMKALMAEAIRRSPGTVDLTHALDGVSVPVYYDWAHTNELGARVLGRALWRAVGDRVAQPSTPVSGG